MSPDVRCPNCGAYYPCTSCPPPQDKGDAMTRTHCRDCAYWCQVTARCRRHAPKTVVRRPGQSDHLEHEWPRTEGHDWCGEGVARAQALGGES